MKMECLLFVSQQIQTNFVIVINPGSRSVRIGRATDTLPVTVPHVIARRHKQSGQPRYEDPWLIRDGLNVSTSAQSLKYFLLFYYIIYLLYHCVQQKPESNEQRQNGLKMVDQAIWSKKMSNGVRRTPVSAEQVCIWRKKIINTCINTSISAFSILTCTNLWDKWAFQNKVITVHLIFSDLIIVIWPLMWDLWLLYSNKIISPSGKI